MTEGEKQAADTGISVERRGRLEIWTLDRVDRRNALSRAAVRELGRLARAAHHDRELRAIIVTGAGDQAFCAGADLKERKDMSEEEVRDFLSLYRTSFWAIDRCPVPVIAAINGAAFGGGLELALACDLRIASPSAQLGLTETSLAVIPGAGGTQRLVREIGAASARELILFARRLDAAEALSIGLVHKLTGPGQNTLDAAIQWCAPLIEAAPIAISAALAAIDGAYDLPLEEGLTLERTQYERTLGTRDRVEALEAFAEKRKPVFRGE